MFSFCIISPWLKNGNITEYTKENERVNRLQLVSAPAIFTENYLRLAPIACTSCLWSRIPTFAKYSSQWCQPSERWAHFRLEACTNVRSIQGNILITDGGVACLGDFGITGLITDHTVMEPGSPEIYNPSPIRYVAPELLNPSQFSLVNSNPSKESDIYSLAMTAYEVSSPCSVHGYTYIVAP